MNLDSYKPNGNGEGNVVIKRNGGLKRILRTTSGNAVFNVLTTNGTGISKETISSATGVLNTNAFPSGSAVSTDYGIVYIRKYVNSLSWETVVNVTGPGQLLFIESPVAGATGRVNQIKITLDGEVFFITVPVNQRFWFADLYPVYSETQGITNNDVSARSPNRALINPNAASYRFPSLKPFVETRDLNRGVRFNKSICIEIYSDAGAGGVQPHSYIHVVYDAPDYDFGDL